MDSTTSGEQTLAQHEVTTAIKLEHRENRETE